MSAPVSDDVLRELGALPRRFRSVAKAVLFFDRYSSAKGAITQDPSRALLPGMPVSRAQKEQDRATYDRLLLVFRALDPGVDEENLHWSLRVTMDTLSGESGYSLSFLAESHDFPDERGFMRYVGHTERILRSRMVAHGVWRQPVRCDCGCGVEQREDA